MTRYSASGAFEELRVVPLDRLQMGGGDVLGRIVERAAAGTSLLGQWAAKVS
jgi:hypothetical protein